jgi:urea transport system permease protein
MNIPKSTLHFALATLGTLLLLLFSIGCPAEDTPPALTVSAALESLRTGSMQDRELAIGLLADDAQYLPLLQALQDGKLYADKSSNQLVIGQDTGTGRQFTDALSGAALTPANTSEVSKININNKLRTEIRKAIGQLQLNATDPQLRLSAVQAIANNADPKAIELLRNRLLTETDTHIQATIQRVLLLQDMESSDKATRLSAINQLKDLDDREVFNRLQTITELDSEGHYLEADSDIRNLAASALSKINTRLQAYAAIETLFFGLSLGAVLVLAATGLAITFGVMGVINMAHGELMMLGAYTTYVMQQLLPEHLGVALISSIPLAFVVTALVGVLIERGIIRFLYGRPLETLLATFGVSLFLQQTVRSIFSPLNRNVATPEWMSGSWQINDFLSLTWNRFYILLFCLLVFSALLQILKHTRLGLEVRAVAQNRGMAKAMGIPTARVDAMTFGLGSGIAGVAGVALSQITNVGPNLGQAYIVDSFMVVVFGGVGNLLGTLVAGFSLGIANKVLEPYAGAVLAKILMLLFIILFIQKRPRGLFPQKGRAVEN